MQINDPLDCRSDNAIGAVLVFACCAVNNLIQTRYMRSSSLEFNSRQRGFQYTYAWTAADTGPSRRLTYTKF
jgi:hypothetical protein